MPNTRLLTYIYLVVQVLSATVLNNQPNPNSCRILIYIAI